MENLYEDKLPLQEPRGLSALLWLTGRFCCSAVVPYKFSLWKLSPSFCPSLSWQQIFISIKLSHSFASKLVDKLHSYKVTQDKLNGSKSHVTCDGDSRSRETCGHTEAPPLLPLLPPSLNFDLPCSWSPQDLVVLSVTDMRCCERQDESHVGLIKYSHRYTQSLSLAGWCELADFGGKPYIVFAFPFPWSHWHDQWEVPKPDPASLPNDPKCKTVKNPTDKQGKGLVIVLFSDICACCYRVQAHSHTIQVEISVTCQ